MFKVELRQEPMNGDFVLTNNNGNEIKFSISLENMDETEKLENFLSWLFIKEEPIFYILAFLWRTQSSKWFKYKCWLPNGM